MSHIKKLVAFFVAVFVMSICMLGLFGVRNTQAKTIETKPQHQSEIRIESDPDTRETSTEVSELEACTHYSDAPKVELITEENIDLVSEKTQGTYVIVNTEPELTSENSENEFNIPQNNIVRELSDDSVFPGISITCVETKNGTTPAVFGENGAVGIFTEDAESGWMCDVGTKILFHFEKHKNDTQQGRTLAVGYVKDGVMYPPAVYQEEEAGVYEVAVTEAGEFYIYVLFASSDRLALKEGKISVN